MSSKYTNHRTIDDIVAEYSENVATRYLGNSLIDPSNYPPNNIHLLKPDVLSSYIEMHIESLNYFPYNQALSTRISKITTIIMLLYMLLETTYYQDYLEYIENNENSSPDSQGCRE